MKFLLPLCLLATSLAPAQQTCMGGMAMGHADDTQPVPPPEQLPAPIHMTGIGNAHIAIKATPEAQVWFDQGLNLMHDFWDYESIKAFEQAIRVDPQCAMCFWGLAQSEGFLHSADQAYGQKALAQAVALKFRASKSDKLYIEAAAKSKEKGDAQAIATYRKLVRKFPEELEARIFLANALNEGFDEQGEPKAGTREAISILEGVMRDSPNDSAANHYWIHAMEPGNHPERAIPSAARLASLAPTSGHMVHMPGHIYYRVGDYADADTWFTASTAADERYMHDQHVSPDDDWNYVHNMMYGIANLIEQGRLAEADALSDRLAGARGRLSATLYIWSARDQMTRVSNRLPVALRLADWDGVIALLAGAKIPETANTANLRFMTARLADYATGMSALDRSDLPAAQKASNALDAGLWRKEQDAKLKQDGAKKDIATKDASPTQPVNPDAELDPLLKQFSVASLELRASILAARNQLGEAKTLFTSAIAEEKKLGYHEPPFYIRPVAETEAAALLHAKDYAGATAAFEAALVARPKSGFELFGLAQTAELSDQPTAARTAYAAFLKAWPTADPSLPQIAHARQVLGSTPLATR